MGSQYRLVGVHLFVWQAIAQRSPGRRLPLPRQPQKASRLTVLETGRFALSHGTRVGHGDRIPLAGAKPTPGISSTALSEQPDT